MFAQMSGPFIRTLNQGDIATGGVAEACDDLQECGLPRAAAAVDDRQGPGWQLQADVLQQRMLRAGGVILHAYTSSLSVMVSQGHVEFELPPLRKFVLFFE